MTERSAENDAPPAANRCGWDLCGDPNHRVTPPEASEREAGK
jgi:hypothetical protein